jgi:hypothetical protein
VLQGQIYSLQQLSLFYFVLKNWFNVEIPQWDVFVELLLAVLVGFGIINNPTNKDNF